MIDVHQNATLSESFEGDRLRFIGNRCNKTLEKMQLINKIDNENDVLFQKVTQAYSEKNPSAPIRSRT